MFNFDYRNPTHIVFGKDRIAEIDKLIPPQARVLVSVSYTHLTLPTKRIV